MHKTLAAFVLIAASALTLTGCAPQNAADAPAGGRWVTAQTDDNKPVGDVWCLYSSHTTGRTSFDCQWFSLTEAGTHKDAEVATGYYRYIIAADQKEHKVFCIAYSLRKNTQMTSCNMESIQAS